MIKTVKIFVPKNTEFYYKGMLCETANDYYTTITLDTDNYEFSVRNPTITHWALSLALPNLMKQVAIKEWGTYKVWKSIMLDRCDLKIASVA